MWQARIQEIEKGQKFTICEQQQVLSFAEVITQWQKEAAFRNFFISLLAEAPYQAFFWETPPVTSQTLYHPFEFVLIDSPALANVEAEAHYFAEHFKEGTDVVTFPNLGKDALLVVPCPVARLSAYPHLAAFVRHAPPPQIHALWQAVGNAMEQLLGSSPLWLSTSGLGVYWLHVRLDARPKYYQYQPYKVNRMQ
jgi:hypothetical protein